MVYQKYSTGKANMSINITGLDHVGFSVSNMDTSIDFYKILLQSDPIMRRFYPEQYVATVVGDDKIAMDAAFFKIGSSNVILELLEYQIPPNARVDMETYNVGNGHLCLIVDDLDAEYERLMPHKMAFRSPKAISIPIGPYKGGKACYLRDPDGISIELLQPPISGNPDFSGDKG